jgi:hypothetical protein
MTVVVWANPALAAEGRHCVPADIVLWGDGRHDDTFALNAWLAGKEAVWAASGDPVGGHIAGRSFRLSDAVYVRAGTGRRLDEFRLVWPERGETVAGGAIETGSDPDRAPILSGVSIVGGDSGEGVAFDLPDPAPGAPADPASCATS